MIYKSYKIIFTVLILSIGFLIGVSNVLAQGDLSVIFNPDPLFNETNFVPGDVSTATATVTNNSSETKKIGISGEVTGASITSLANALDFKVSENGTVLYGDGSSTGAKTLEDFFEDSPNGIYLSDLGPGQSATYTLTATFLPKSGNQYQATYTKFNFDIGFFPIETISGQGGPSGGGGAVLILPNGETTIIGVGGKAISENELIIVWSTQNSLGNPKNTYGGVIYGTESVSDADLGNPPNYGYQFRKNEPGLPFCPDHSVALTGLSAGTTYYYRVVSWASPEKVSSEYTFTTLSKITQQQKKNTPQGKTTGKAGQGQGLQNPSPSVPPLSPLAKGKTKQPVKQVLEGKVLPTGRAAKKTNASQTLPTSPISQKKATPSYNFMASLGGLISKTPWWLLVIIGILLLIGVFLTRGKRRKRS